MANIAPAKFILKDGTNLTVRAFDGSDAKAMNAFRRQLSEETKNTNHYPGMPLPSTEEAGEFLQKQHDHPISIGFGAFDGEKLVASLGLVVNKYDHPWIKHIGIFGMGVIKKYYGNGIGKMLLEVQEQYARKAGITRIEAMVRANNQRGINLYTRNGFTIEGTRKNSAFIDGEYINEYFIAKILNEEASWEPPTLKTDRLVLRPLKVTDAEDIYEYAKNPNVSKYTLWEPHQSLIDAKEYVKDYAFKYYSNKTPEPLGISFKNDPDKIIGTVGCFWVSKNAKTMELAYAITEDHWGKGITAEASQAIIDYCFKNYSVKRLQCRCKSENKASARVMEKLGMKYEGTLKAAVFHRDKHWDMLYYSIVK